jgi:hypothetical protein
MSTSYKRYAVIYKTSIVDPIDSVVNDPVRFRVFTASNSSYDIPAQTSRVFVADEGGVIGSKAELILLDGQTYLEIVARTKEANLIVAQTLCEAEVNKYMAILSTIYSVDLFDQLIYSGWILDDSQALISAWVKRVEKIAIETNELTILHDKLKNLESSDAELFGRYLLMTKFYAKSVAYDPSEEKFLFLWTILEVYPMMGTPKGKTNVKSVAQYLAPILNLPADDIMKKLELGRMYGLRSGLVHAGHLEVTIEELGSLLDKLEAIVRTILRNIGGLQYQNDLDEYLA